MFGIAFSIVPAGGGGAPEAVVPVVGGVALTDRIHAFELAAGMKTTQGPTYGGLPVRGFRFGPASEHYLGRSVGVVEPTRVPLLACVCGELACHPLFAHVVADTEVVRWVRFQQPPKPARDYAGFGPFVFERARYEAAIESLGDLWAA